MGEYKSMVEVPTGWLGSIPEHWECKKIGSLFSERKTKVSDADYPPLSVTKLGIVPQLANAAKSDSGDNRKLVCSGDFVINSRSDRKGSCGVSELDGSVSLINIVLTPRNSWDNKYVHYLMRSQPFSEEYYHYGRGIVADLWTTRYSEMKNILLPVPPHDEQEQIVRFLDWKVSGINKLINIKKKEIERLCELRNSTIDSGILHGFHNGDMKSSGIYWLGDIPSTWEVMPIKRVAKINASVADIVKVLDDEDLVTFLPMENVSERGEIDCSIKRPLNEVKSGYSSFAKGDVVVAKITPCFENGKGACLDELDKLPSPQDDDLSQGILETIDLDSYRNEARETMSIQLDDADSEIAPVPAGKSGHIVSPEMDLLSIIVSEFNDMFGNIDWKEPDNARRQILEIPAMVSKDEKYRNAMRNSDEQSAKLESERALQQVIFSIMADNMEIFKQYQDNPSFKKWLSDLVFNLTYNKEGNTYEAPITGKVTSYQNVDTPTLMVAEHKTEYKTEK